MTMLLGLAASALGAPPGNQKVSAQLLADRTAIVPGKPFHVGVLLTIAANWHVYWKNPGDAGLPTTVSFHLPDGFSLTDLQYPVPANVLQPGDITAYGYANSVLLMATVTPPAKIAARDAIPITASGSFLVCEQVCLPGKLELSLSLPVAAESQPANEAVFSQWRPLMPIAKSADDYPIQRSAMTRQPGEDPKSVACVLSVSWKSNVTDVEFFPGRSDAFTLRNISVHSSGRTTSIEFKLEQLAGQKTALASLESLVAYTDSSGARHAAEIDVPLQPQ
jgi:DsbC/DsbD-like thiol-disulfide interchange protein